MKLFKLFSAILACIHGNGKGHAYAYGHDKNKHANSETNKVPIDGGISLLLVAGAALGAKRVFQKTKKITSEAE